MRFKKIPIVSVVLCFALSACGLFIYHDSEYGYGENIATSKNQNVCGLLKDSVVVYAIFVDVDQYHPWTVYDIESTMDSLNKAMSWVEGQAAANKQRLGIVSVMHEQQSKWSISEARAKPTVLRLNLNLLGSYKKKHQGHVDAWADKIATYAAKGVKKPTETKLGTKSKVVNVERLVARLRDLYETDNVALLFFLNGYYENHPSMSLHTYSNGPAVEYSIITNKNPAVIAHEFLHLFGAIDLYPHPAHRTFNYKELEAAYPNELMRIQHTSINSLMLSPITKYYIGWQKNLDKENTRMLYHLYNVTEY